MLPGAAESATELERELTVTESTQRDDASTCGLPAFCQDGTWLRVPS